MPARANDPILLADRPTGVCDLTLLMPDTGGRFPVASAPTSPRVRASLDPSADTDAPRGSLILAGDGTTQPYVMGPSSATVTLGSLIGASTLSITDGSTWYTADNLQGVADAVVAAVGGTSQGVRSYSENNAVTDNETLVASIEALDLYLGDLASTANGEGASLVGIEDAGGLITATTVEGALAENRTAIDLNTTARTDLQDTQVIAAVAVADATGGATDAALTLQIYRRDGSTPIASARQVMVYASVAQYNHFAAISGTLTFATATTGSIIASGAGWALVETDATGAFACTATNSADETVYFAVDTPSAGVSDTTKGVMGVISNNDPATWSA